MGAGNGRFEGREGLRHDGVVAVQEKQIGSGRSFQPSIPGAALALVLLMNHPNERGMLRRQSVTKRRTDPVRGPVVHKKNLAVLMIPG